MDGLEVETVEVTADAKGNVSIPVPESVVPQQPAPAVPADLSFKSGDLMSDLAKLAAEQGTVAPAAVQAPPVVPEIPRTVEPEQSATTPATPVPVKFLNPDGTVNEEKVAKSTVNAEEALAKYAEIERQLRQKQNEVAALKNPAPTQPPAQAVPQNTPLSPLEHAMAQDLINKAAAQGLTLDPRLAVAQAQVMAQGLEARHAAELSVTADIRERLDMQDRRTELEKIAQTDDWVLSPEGVKVLSEIRQSRPHVNASKTPWTTAYREYLADQAMNQRLTGQVTNPTPKGPAAKAPPTPVGPAPRVVVKSAEPNFNAMSVDEISRYAASLGPKAEAEFWAKRGFKL
jgi:hypothetical protein